MKSLRIYLVLSVIALLVAIAPARCASEVETRAIQLNNQGVMLLNEQKFLEAISKFQESLHMLPSYKLARNNLCVACNNYGLQLKDQPEQALEWFELSVYLDDTNPQSRANLEGIIRMLGYDPGDFLTYDSLGNRAFFARRKAGCIVHYTKALSIKNDETVKRKLEAALLEKWDSYAAGKPMSFEEARQNLAPKQSTTAPNHNAAAPTQQKIVSAPVSSTPVPVTNEPKNRPVKDKWALVVGISKFQNPSLNLKYPDKDARDFASFLVSSCHFAADHVKVLTNEQATRASILNHLGDKWLPRVVRPDDLVVLYFSSHGSPSTLDAVGVNYLLATDSDPENLYSSGLAMQDIGRVIKERLRSDRVIVILDACYSGNANPSAKGIHRQSNVNAEEIAQGTGQMVISSSDSNQASWESKRQPNSVFTRHLMSSLTANGDKTQLGTAFNLLKDRVEDEVQRDRGVVQIPVMKSLWKGRDVMLSAPPTDPRPGL